MGDEVSFTRDGRTYRVRGLQAKGQSIASASTELGGLISGRLTAARSALAEWRGPHALTFVTDANAVLTKMASQKVDLWEAGNMLSAFPDRPQASWGHVRYMDEIYMGAQVDVPVAPGTASANPPHLRSFVTTASGQDERFATLAGLVNLTGITAAVTYNRPLTQAERQRAIDNGEHPADLDGTLVPQTDPVDPATLITLPTPGDAVPALTSASRTLNQFTLAVATAFETGDAAMLARLAKDPYALRDQLNWLRGDPRRWGQLTPTEQLFLIQVFPAEIGSMNGIPAIARDQANRIVLQRTKEALQARIAEIDRMVRDAPPPAPSKFPVQNPTVTALLNEKRDLEAKLGGIGAIEQRLAGVPGRPPAFLLGFDTNGNGHAIVAIGNPDYSANVATLVPGTGANLAGVGGLIERADRMAFDANALDPGSPTSVIMWLGYDAPQSIPSATRDHYADDGESALRAFQDGLDVSWAGGDGGPHKTVVGHSYGTVVIGHTLRDGNLNTDDVIFVASPGVGVDHASDLHIASGHVYATTAQNDVIRAVPESIHHRHPHIPDFGANVFESAPGSSGWIFGKSTAAHSEYWEPGNPARRGMAAIVTGHPELNTYQPLPTPHVPAPGEPTPIPPPPTTPPNPPLGTPNPTPGPAPTPTG